MGRGRGARSPGLPGVGYGTSRLPARFPVPSGRKGKAAMAQPWFRELLRQVWSGAPGRQGPRPGRPARRKRRARAVAVELLEDRTLLDATLQAITVATVAPPSVSAAAGSSADASVSADGRYVAYESTATNLIPGQQRGA